MKYILILLSLVLATPCYSYTVAETKTKLKTVKRIKSESKNKSMHDLKGLTIKSRNIYGQNFSYADFDGAVLVGTFERCNFSYSVNLDKADCSKAEFIECNFSFADLPVENMTKCNKIRLEQLSQKDLDEKYTEADKLQLISEVVK